jgi:hypothetical protein
MRKIPYFYIKLLLLAPYNACRIRAVLALSRRDGSCPDSLLMGSCACNPFETVLVISLSLVSSQTNKFLTKAIPGLPCGRPVFFACFPVQAWQDDSLARCVGACGKSFGNYLRNVIFL